MKSYIFHVSLRGTGRTWRKIELCANQTLHDLHLAIQSAFDWDDDHLYAFYMSGKAWDRNSEYGLPEGYTPWGELIEDEEEEENDAPEKSELTREELEALLRQLFGPDSTLTLAEMEAKIAELRELFGAEDEEAGPGNALETELSALNLQLRQEFMYLFDFGDEHRFKVRVFAINEQADPAVEYPRLVETVGASPRQYGNWDDE